MKVYHHTGKIMKKDQNYFPKSSIWYGDWDKIRMVLQVDIRANRKRPIPIESVRTTACSPSIALTP